MKLVIEHPNKFTNHSNMSNFQLLEVVGRGSEPQLQEGEK